MPTEVKDDTERLGLLSELLTTVAADLTRYPVLAGHAPQMEAVAHDLRLPPLVVVMGTFNSGKSTLLNVMLGQTLLSMNVLPETATVTMLRKGKGDKIFAHSDGHPIRKWPISKLASLSSETDPEAASLRESLSFIEVPIDLPLLATVTLVDTPGINAICAAHPKATKSFSHRSEAVLWIVSCLSPLNNVEESWINELPSDVKVLIVINQIDLLDLDESPLSRLIERVRNNIRRPNVSVTAVSARLALEGVLTANKNALDASLWPAFLQDCHKQIFAFDKAKRIQRAYKDVKDLIDALHADIQTHLREADEYRLKARGGREYFDSLDSKLHRLADSESTLSKSEDVRDALESLSIEEYWDSSRGLEIKRLALVGALLAIDAKQSEINHGFGACHEKHQTLQRDVARFNDDWKEYMTSGLFGGEPKWFTGGKDKLLRRKENLEDQQSSIEREHKNLQWQNRDLDATRSRTKSDCAAFIELVREAIRQTIASVVCESESSVEEQDGAARKLSECHWLVEYAKRVKKRNLGSLVEKLDSEARSNGWGNDLNQCLKRFMGTIDGIPQQEWSIAVQSPLSAPKAIKRVGDADGNVASFVTRSTNLWRMGFDVATWFVLLPFRILATSFQGARKHPIFAIFLGVIFYFVIFKSGLWHHSTATPEVAIQASSQATQSSADSGASAAKIDSPTTGQSAAGSGSDPDGQRTESTEQEAKSLYDQGHYTDAIPLFDQACSVDGAKEACVELGNLYRDGIGVAIDKSRATNLFQKACTMGDQDGCHQLKELQALDALDAPDTTSEAARKQREKAALKALEQ